MGFSFYSPDFKLMDLKTKRIIKLEYIELKINIYYVVPIVKL